MDLTSIIYNKTIKPKLFKPNFPIKFTNPSARAGYDTRSIFKWSLTGLNSEFSSSLSSCLTKAKELSPPYYLPITFLLFSYLKKPVA